MYIDLQFDRNALLALLRIQLAPAIANAWRDHGAQLASLFGALGAPPGIQFHSVDLESIDIERTDVWSGPGVAPGNVTIFAPTGRTAAPAAVALGRFPHIEVQLTVRIHFASAVPLIDQTHPGSPGDASGISQAIFIKGVLQTDPGSIARFRFTRATLCVQIPGFMVPRCGTELLSDITDPAVRTQAQQGLDAITEALTGSLLSFDLSPISRLLGSRYGIWNNGLQFHDEGFVTDLNPLPEVHLTPQLLTLRIEADRIWPSPPDPVFLHQIEAQRTLMIGGWLLFHSPPNFGSVITGQTPAWLLRIPTEFFTIMLQENIAAAFDRHEVRDTGAHITSVEDPVVTPRATGLHVHYRIHGNVGHACAGIDVGFTYDFELDVSANPVDTTAIDIRLDVSGGADTGSHAACDILTILIAPVAGFFVGGGIGAIFGSFAGPPGTLAGFVAGGICGAIWALFAALGSVEAHTGVDYISSIQPTELHADPTSSGHRFLATIPIPLLRAANLRLAFATGLPSGLAIGGSVIVPASPVRTVGVSYVPFAAEPIAGCSNLSPIARAHVVIRNDTAEPVGAVPTTVSGGGLVPYTILGFPGTAPLETFVDVSGAITIAPRTSGTIDITVPCDIASGARSAASGLRLRVLTTLGPFDVALDDLASFGPSDCRPLPLWTDRCNNGEDPLGRPTTSTGWWAGRNIGDPAPLDGSFGRDLGLEVRNARGTLMARTAVLAVEPTAAIPASKTR